MIINPEHFFLAYRQAYSPLSQPQVDGLTELITSLSTDTLTDPRQVAYVLATIKHETADTFQPIVERGQRSYFDKYEHRQSLGNTEQGDGFRFRGRGYVQITGRHNYQTFTRLLGVDLISNPDLALVPEHAYKIATMGMQQGLFTGKALRDHINEHVCDYFNARRIINGIDRAEHIAGFARQFEHILRTAQETT